MTYYAPIVGMNDLILTTNAIATLLNFRLYLIARRLNIKGIGRKYPSPAKILDPVNTNCVGSETLTVGNIAMINIIGAMKINRIRSVII